MELQNVGKLNRNVFNARPIRGGRTVDPSAAAASRRAEFLGMPRRRRIFLWLSRIPA